MEQARIERVRDYAKAILHALPPEEPKGDLGALVAQMKELLPQISAPPWYLSDIDDEEGYDMQTLAAHEPPHYEETVAQFYPGNHGTGPAEMAKLVFNNLELIIGTLEKAVER